MAWISPSRTADHVRERAADVDAEHADGASISSWMPPSSGPGSRLTEHRQLWHLVTSHQPPFREHRIRLSAAAPHSGHSPSTSSLRDVDVRLRRTRIHLHQSLLLGHSDRLVCSTAPRRNRQTRTGVTAGRLRRRARHPARRGRGRACTRPARGTRSSRASTRSSRRIRLAAARTIAPRGRPLDTAEEKARERRPLTCNSARCSSGLTVSAPRLAAAVSVSLSRSRVSARWSASADRRRDAARPSRRPRHGRRAGLLDGAPARVRRPFHLVLLQDRGEALAVPALGVGLEVVRDRPVIRPVDGFVSPLSDAVSTALSWLSLRIWVNVSPESCQRSVAGSAAW